MHILLQCSDSMDRSNIDMNEESGVSKMQIVCILCGKEFKTRHDLKIHNAVHTGKRSFTCKQCNKSFTQAGTLGRHEKHHSDEKPFSCQHCSKTFHEAGQFEVIFEFIQYRSQNLCASIVKNISKPAKP